MPKTEIKAPKLDEPCTAEELAEWSKGRFLAGQHEAAFNIQSRYEALVKAQNPNVEVSFYRNEETGELTHELQKSADDLELERMQKEEDEEKRKAEAKRKSEEEVASKKKAKKEDSHE